MMKIKDMLIKPPKVLIDDKTRKKTYSTIFLLPALMIDKAKLDRFGFVNCYWSDKEKEVKYNSALYVLFEPEFNEEFENFIKEQKSRTDIEFLEDYDVGDKQVMLIFRFPEKFKKEYFYFKKGQYSKFGKDYVRLFPMTKKETSLDGKSGKVVSSVFAGIFNKEEWLKKYWEDKLDTNVLPNEYWSVPDEKKEVFRS